MQLAAEAVAAGDVSAISPYLKVLDRFDRYQTVASANQVYDDEARKKLFDKINRVASNLGVDEVMRNTAREHLKKIGVVEDRAGERGSPDRCARGAGGGKNLFKIGRKSLKSPDPKNKKKQMQAYSFSLAFGGLRLFWPRARVNVARFVSG